MRYRPERATSICRYVAPAPAARSTRWRVAADTRSVNVRPSLTTKSRSRTLGRSRRGEDTSVSSPRESVNQTLLERARAVPKASLSARVHTVRAPGAPGAEAAGAAAGTKATRAAATSAANPHRETVGADMAGRYPAARGRNRCTVPAP